MDAIRKGEKEFSFGYTPIAELDGMHSDMLMDFGVLRLKEGDSFKDNREDLERAFMLIYGEVTLQWDGMQETVSRKNCFDCSPWTLHVPKGVKVSITGIGADSELTVHRTGNETKFDPKLYRPEECEDEFRGAGLMRETSTRIVRTVFDKSNAPWSNLVLGEVIGFPGKWSSYPPHHHPQPEIYYYKTNPENGFGYAELGDEVLKVHQNDTVFIGEGLTHPHVTAPGYALWYMWVIRHLDGNPYITPTFLPEYLWVLEKDAVYWGDDKKPSGKD